jgi:hypothetical protein
MDNLDLASFFSLTAFNVSNSCMTLASISSIFVITCRACKVAFDGVVAPSAQFVDPDHDLC